MSETTDQFWLGFDLGGTKILATLFDDEFYPVSRQRARIRGAEGKQAGMKAIVDLIEKTLAATTVKRSDLGGIGIGCPGPLDLETGTIIEAPNLGWKNVQVQSILEKKFGCPATVINDVDAGVFGEYSFGAARALRDWSLSRNRHRWRMRLPGQNPQGTRSSCMEIGHIQVVADGELCGCQRRGCLETVASRLVIAARVAAAAYRGKAPYIYEHYGTDLANIRSGALAAAIAAGDEIVAEIVADAARHLGVAIGNLVNLLNPDVVVLGGGLVEAMPNIFIKGARRAANERCMPCFADTFDVTAAKLGDDASTMGAAAWARVQFADAA